MISWYTVAVCCTAVLQLMGVTQAFRLREVTTHCCSVQVYGLVFIDGVSLGRTRVMAEPPYIFEENFTFE